MERGLISNDGIATVFFGALTYTGGADNDSITLGLDANDNAVTVGAAKFTGGLGSNTLDDDFVAAIGSFKTTGFTII